MQQLEWVMLVYKIASEPTKYRATIWREIKRLGGVYLQNGVCIFPDIDDVALNVSSLAKQIRGMGGKEYVFFSTAMTSEESDDLVGQFQESRTEEYEVLLAETKELARECKFAASATDFTVLHVEYRRLKKHFQLIKARDYFAAPAGERVSEQLEAIQALIYHSVKG